MHSFYSTCFDSVLSVCSSLYIKVSVSLSQPSHKSISTFLVSTALAVVWARLVNGTFADSTSAWHDLVWTGSTSATWQHSLSRPNRNIHSVDHIKHTVFLSSHCKHKLEIVIISNQNIIRHYW